MIRLRREIDRALAHRWLRLLLVLLLVGLFVLLVFHTTQDGLGDDGAALVCVALVLIVALVLPPRTIAVPRLRVVSDWRRGPPPTRPTPAHEPVFSGQLIPLRS